MDILWFWVVAGGLALGVAALLVLSLVRARAAEADGDAARGVQVYKDQLAEVDRDLARGTIAAAEAERLRTEIARRLIEADRTAARGLGAGGTSRAGLVPGLLVVAAVAGGLLIYREVGVPGYPDMPLGPRLAALDAGIASRPSQAEELERLGRPRAEAEVATLKAELAAQSDVEALRQAFETRFSAGELTSSVLTMERILEVLGDKATTYDHSALAVALVSEAEGYVSPEAETALRAALQADLSNEMARYLVGEMFLQGGRYDQAFRFWRPIAEQGTPEAPWVKMVQERIETVAELAGIRYSLPAGAGRGPTAEDMAAAADMTPEERQAMIEGMVAQLGERLASEGGPAEDWAKLITSLAALGRLDEARAIYAEAQKVFEGRTVELSGLREAAVTAGVAE